MFFEQEIVATSVVTSMKLELRITYIYQKSIVFRSLRLHQTKKKGSVDVTLWRLFGLGKDLRELSLWDVEERG